MKQIWDLWSVNVVLAMSTCDVAVTYWHQVYIQSEESYQRWRRSGMADRFAYEKRYLYGRKAPVPATCDSVEALLRHELLAHTPEWLSRKVGVLGCTSSHTILFMCWKEIFPNEDATRFDLVDELYTLPAKMPTSMFQFAAWLEDWMTKLVVAEEVAAHVEPRRAMAVLMNVGKPLQTSDNIFMTEWVAIFRESGLRDDVTIANLQDACLKLVVLARAGAQNSRLTNKSNVQQPLSAKTATPTTKPKPKSSPATDKPVCRFFLKPDGCKNGDNCQYAHPRTNGKCLWCGSDSRNLQACTRPRRQQSSRSDSVKPASKKTHAKPKGKAADTGFQYRFPGEEEIKRQVERQRQPD